MNGSETCAALSRWALPAALGGAAVLLQLSGDPGAWRLERGLSLSEPWRLLTGHLVHLGWAHLAMNLAGLAVLWALLAPVMRPRHWSVVALACAAGVSLGLLAFSPGVDWYAGLSGVLHGIAAAGAVAGLRAMPATAGLLLAGLAIKLAFEQAAGGDPGTARLIGDAVIVDAHLYGALTGLVLATLLRLRAPA